MSFQLSAADGYPLEAETAGEEPTSGRTETNVLREAPANWPAIGDDAAWPWLTVP
jgi:hypothetical protein